MGSSELVCTLDSICLPLRLPGIGTETLCALVSVCHSPCPLQLQRLWPAPDFPFFPRRDFGLSISLGKTSKSVPNPRNQGPPSSNGSDKGLAPALATTLTSNP